MFRIPTLHTLLLACALLLSQWLAIAHDYQHPVLAGDETCQVCLHGPGFQGGPAAAPVLASTWLTSEAPLADRPDPVTLHRYTRASIRAPPALLV